MKIFIKSVIVTVILFSIINCGGTAEKANSNIASAPTGIPANTVNTETNADANTNLIPHPGFANANGNLSNANGNIKVVNIDPKQLKPTNPAVPAGDNSEILSVLNEKGVVETRTFKNHPTLAKIERTAYGREMKIKVFLKNGKTFELAPDKITDFVNEPAAQILKAVGIETPPPAPKTATDAKTQGSQTEKMKESPPVSNPTSKKP